MTARKRFSAGAVTYDRVVATSYLAGRGLSDDAVTTWRKAIEPFIPRTSTLTILDLGAGTGRFSSLLADVAGARVIGIEPSQDMLRVAVQHDPRAVVAYVCGIAEAIPLRDQSCSLAWMSQVLHHVRDRPACARELRRILIPGGRVLVRGTFADHLDGFPTLFHFFPGARQVCEDLPTAVETAIVFEVAGFALEAHRRVDQNTCGSLREFVERTRRRADTSLALLSDREFHVGLAALERAAAEEVEPTPIRETLDLLVFASEFKCASPNTA